MMMKHNHTRCFDEHSCLIQACLWNTGNIVEHSNAQMKVHCISVFSMHDAMYSVTQMFLAYLAIAIAMDRNLTQAIHI